MRKARLLIGLCLLMLFATVVPALAGPTIDAIMQRKTLLVGTSGDVPPLSFKTKNGDFKGLDMDLGRMIAGAIGVNFKIVSMPFDELIPALEKGKIDVIISCMTITPKRNLRVAYAGPYFMTGQSLLTVKKTAVSIKGPADMNKPDFSVAVPAGSTSELYAAKQMPQASRVAVGSTNEALNLLLQNKVDGVIADYPFCLAASLRHRDKGLVSNPPFTLEPVGIATRADDPLFVNLLQNFLSLLQVSGKIQEMTRGWFDDPSWLKELPDDAGLPL